MIILSFLNLQQIQIKPTEQNTLIEISFVQNVMETSSLSFARCHKKGWLHAIEAIKYCSNIDEKIKYVLALER